MVSTLAASLLTRYLGEYLDDLSKDNVKLSFMSGDALLQDVRIKHSALQRIFPNIVIKHAVVRKLSLHIPWNQLEGIYVLAAPGQDFDEQYYRKQFQDEKQQKLLLHELLRSKSGGGGAAHDGQGKGEDKSAMEDDSSSFGGRLLATVIDNLQLYIDSVHIRFEDELSNGPFAVGLTLSSLVAESTDEHWTPSFLKKESSVVHKLIDMRDLAVYWSSNAQPLSYANTADLAGQLAAMVRGEGDLSYVLPPLSSRLKAVLNKSLVNPTLPKYTVQLALEDAQLSLSDAQYQDATDIMERLSLFRKSIEFRADRPLVSAKAAPRQWWAYAINAIRGRIHTAHYRRSWTHLFEFLRDKKEYIKLFKRHKRATIHAAERTRMESLEWKLSLEHIILFRNLAFKMMAREDLVSAAKKKLAPPPAPVAPPAAGGWFSGWWSAPLPTPTKPADDIPLSKEDWREIYDTIGYEETTPVATGDFSDIVQANITVSFTTVSLRLVRRGHMLAMLQLANLELNLRTKESSYLFDCVLAGLELIDHSTPGTNFPRLVEPCIKHLAALPESSTSSESSNGGGLFHMTFQRNSPNAPNDYSINVQSKPLMIVYYPAFVNTIINFFRVNSTSADIFEDLERMAQTTIQSFAAQTRERLALAISNRKTLSLTMELEAPIILVPDDINVSDQSNTLVFDLGNLVINHTPRTTTPESKHKDSIKDNKESSEIEDFYDEYLFKLTDIQVLLAGQRQDWRDEKEVAKHCMNIANPFNAHFSLKISKLANRLLTSLRLAASVDLLEFYLSSQQYVNFITVVQSVTASKSQVDTAQNTGLPSPALEADFFDPPDLDTKLLEATFDVRRLNVHLRMDMTNGARENLALVYLRRIEGVFTQRYYDTSMSLAVKGLWIEDTLQKPPGNGNYLAFTSSKVSLDTVDDAPSSQLNALTFGLIQTSPTSPAYQSLDQAYSFDFAQLNLVLNKKTVAGVIEFANSVHTLTIAQLSRRSPTSSPLASDTSSSLPQVSGGVPVQQSNNTIVQMRITLVIAFIRILLTSEHNSPLIKAAITDFGSVADTTRQSTKMHGHIGSLKVYDMTLEGRNYRTIFTTKERSVSTPPPSLNLSSSNLLPPPTETLVHFEFETSASTHRLKCHMRSIRLVFLRRFLDEVRLFLDNVRVMREYLARSLSSAAAVVSAARTAFLYELAIDNPYVVVPLSSLSQQTFIVDLGRILISNRIDDIPDNPLGAIEHIFIEATNLKLLSGLDPPSSRQSSSSSSSPQTRAFGTMVQNINLSIHLETPIGQVTPLPPWAHVFELSQFQLDISEYESRCLIELLDGNLSESSSEIRGDDSVHSEPDAPQDQDESDEEPVTKFHQGTTTMRIGKFSVGFMQRDGANKDDRLVQFVVNDTKMTILSEEMETSIDLEMESRLATLATDAWQRYSTKILGTPTNIIGTDELVQSGATMVGLRILDATIAIPTNARSTGEGEREYALIIRADIDAQSTSRGAAGVETVILVEAENARIYRSRMNQRQESSVKIVEPFKLSFQSTTTPKSRESNIAIDTVLVNFSYQDFKQLMMISSATIASVPTDLPFEPRHAVDMSASMIDEARIAPPPPPDTLQQHYLSIRLEKGTFILHDDHSVVESVPLLSITSSKLKNNTFSWPLKKQVAFSLESSLDSQYYNSNSGVWEPLVEPWAFAITANNSAEGGWISDLASTNPLQINITKGFVDTSISTYQILADDYYNKSTTTSTTSSSSSSSPTSTSPTMKGNNNSTQKNNQQQEIHPYYIRNDTGQVLWYWLTTEELIEVPIGQEIALASGRFGPAGRTRGALEIERKISFQLYGNFKPIKDVPMDTIGTYTIHPMPEYRSVKLLYDISYRKGSKVLSLHSSIILTNRLAIPVVAYISVGANRELDPVDLVIPPHSSVPLPILFSMGRIRVKPANTGYTYSTEQIDCVTAIAMIKARDKQLKEKSKVALTNTMHTKMVCRHSSLLPCSFVASIERASDKRATAHRIEISILPPIIIENVLACDLSYRLYHAKSKRLIGSPFLVGRLAMGQRLDVTTYDPMMEVYMEIQIFDYPWSAPFQVEGSSAVVERIKLLDTNKHPILILFDNRVQVDGGRMVSVYCEFWMINQTGLPLFFKHHIGAQTVDPAGQVDPANLAVWKERDSRLWYGRDWAHPSSPFMFAYNDSTIVGGRFSLKIANSEWSSPFSLNASNTNSNSSTIQIKEERSQEEKRQELLLKRIPEKRLFQLSVNCAPSTSRFWRTRVVTFCPAHIVVNTCSYTLAYQQFECYDHDTQTIHAGQSLPFHLPSGRREKLIRVGVYDTQSSAMQWSGFFNPDELGNIILRLRTDSETAIDRNRKDSDISTRYSHANLGGSATPKNFLSVSIRVKSTSNITTRMLIFGEQNADLPPYRIENRSRFPLWLRQKKTENWERLGPQSSTPYTWDHFILPKKLVIEFPGAEKHSYRLNNLEEFSIVSIRMPVGNAQERVDLEITINAHGPTRVLSVRERSKNPLQPQEVEMREMTKDQHHLDSSAEGQPQETSLAKFESRIKLSNIGISIMNQVPEEIIYCSFDGLFVEFKQSKTDQYLQVELDDLQIDDQRYDTNFPVFLCQSKKVGDLVAIDTSTTNTATKKMPFFQMSVTRSLKYPKIMFFRYFSFLVQEFDVSIDEASVLNALSFININLNSLNEHFTLHPTITPEEILQSDQHAGDMVYFEMLHINPLKINLSFTSCKSPKSIQSVLGARSLAELLLGFKSSSPFLNVERAPIRFNGFIWEHPFLSSKQVTDEIILHFTYQMMGQVHKIFGSFDFIGNPIRLAESLGSGFKDFFHEPAMGIVKSPQDFALGVSKGTSSLVNNSVFGLCDSASKITGTISKGLVHLSLDDSYIRERQESGRQKPQGLKQGLELGIRDLGEGLLKGITGIIDEPIKGATQEKSFEGFLKGVGKGVLGVAVKPTVGIFEFATRASEGIKNTTSIAKSILLIRRRRLPRHIPKDGTLQTYNVFKSTGAFLLYSRLGAPPTSNCTPDYTVMWSIKIADIQQYHKQSNSITIVHAPTRQPPSTTNIPTPNEDVKLSIIRKIHELVTLSRRFGSMDS
eukprot:gene12231-14325_t